jgi:hypothetical protein
MLRKRKNPKTGKSEYALVSSDGTKVLEYFGTAKPSDDRFAKAEQRVEYYKHRDGK